MLINVVFAAGESTKEEEKGNESVSTPNQEKQRFGSDDCTSGCTVFSLERTAIFSQTFSEEILLKNKIFSKENLGEGTGSVWRLSPEFSLDKQIRAVVSECKTSFFKLVEYARSHNLSLKEEDGVQSMGMKAKEGNSVRFICPFSLDGICSAINTIHTDGNEVHGGSVFELRSALIKFHNIMKGVFQKSGLYPKNSSWRTEVVKNFSEEGIYSGISEVDKEELRKINPILHQCFNIFKMFQEQKDVEMQIRLVTGAARYQPPHYDGNTFCVLSLSVYDVYEVFGDQNEKKLFLPNGESFLWFGDSAQNLSSEIKEKLTQSGVEFSSVVELPHGVDYVPEEKNSREAVTLLVMWTPSAKSSAQYCFFPKPLETFQKPLVLKNDIESVKVIQKNALSDAQDDQKTR
ncbi:hypothetical protein P618_200125 [Holospora obtusa F1]|uniref:Uncharacterized protein n=1 Tax=Holospora obtusa F1 TaxID=1399147 RepID=W6TFB5_HOLOB|nr:hypothetical protein [Holospora obtusa]ETZ07679.1 hypothetical protein P618_200125 [Holospora obtusa F1]